MSTLDQKINISFYSATMFFAANLPQTHKLTNSMFGIDSSCPSYNSLIIHTIVFFILSYLTMGDKDVGLKIKYSFYGSLIFYLLSSAPMYCLTSKLFGPNNQCPNIIQILMHSMIYFSFLVGVMYLPN